MPNRHSRRTRRVLILAGCVVALALAATAAKIALDWRRATRAAQALDRGMQAYREGDYARALPDLGRAVSRFKTDPDLLYATADTRRRVTETNGRHISSAIAFARAARDAAPDDPRHRLLLIELYRSAGFVTELLAEADALLALEPANLDGFNARIGALVALGRFGDAIPAARAALEANPSNVACLEVLYDVMNAASRPIEEKQALLDSQSAAFADAPRFVLLQARFQIDRNDLPAAALLVAQALEMDLADPDSLMLVVGFADVMARQNPALFESASRAVDEALQRPELVLPLAAFALQRDWKFLQMAAGARHARALTPDDQRLSPEALGWAALVLRGSPDATPFDSALRQRPQSPLRDHWIATLDAFAALDRSDLAGARAALDLANQAAAQSAGTDNPTAVPPSEFIAARILLASGDTPAARRLLDRLGFQRGWFIARAELLQVLLDEPDIESALAVLNADPILARAGGLPTAFASAAAALIAERRAGAEALVGIEAFVAALAQAEPDNNELKAYHAVALHAIDRNEDAAQLLSAVDPARLSPSARLILASTIGGRLTSAEDIDRLRDTPPTDPDALLGAALIVAAATDARSGLDLFDRVPQNPDPAVALAHRVARGIFLDRVGDPTARDTLAGVAQEHPDSLPAQRAFLDSQSAWTSPDDLEVAIIRFRAIAGPDAASWRIYEARRLLTFDTTEAATARALRLLDEARQSSWPNPVISDLLADAALRESDRAAGRSRAIRHLVEGVQASSQGSSLYPRLVLLLREQGDATEAARQLDALLAREMISPGLRFARADLALFLDRNEEALRDYRFLAQNGSPRAMLGVANALLRLGSWTEADAAYNALASLPEPQPQVLLDYAAALATYGHFERAVQQLERLPETLSGQPRELIIADFYARFGPPDQAERRLRELADAGSPSAATRLAQFLLERGRAPDSLQAATLYLQRFPDSASLREIKALAGMSTGVQSATPVEDIAELARLAHERDPDSAFARLTALMLENARGSIAPAEYVSNLESLIRRDPLHLPTYSALVEAHRAAGNINAAAAAAARASDAVPENPQAAAMAARTLADADDYPRARVYIDRWKARLQAPTPEPDVLAAAIALSQGQAVQAQLSLASWLDALISQARETGAFRPVVAAALVLAGRDADAAALFPGPSLVDAAAADYFAAGTLIAPSSPDLASAWERAAFERMADPQARLFVAQRLLALGSQRSHPASLTAALEVLDLIDAQGDAPTDVASMRASIQNLLNRSDEAVASYRLAIARNPDDILAHNNLSMLLARSPDTAPEAVGLAQRALDLAQRARLEPPVLANILDTCGVAMLASGDPAAAADAFRRGLELDPGSSGCQIGMAEALLAQNDQSAARAAIERIRSSAASLDPETRARLDAVLRQLP